MMKPSLDELVKQTDSRYTLVVTAAKRARQLTDGSPTFIKVESSKPVTVALAELAGGEVAWERAKTGLK